MNVLVLWPPRDPRKAGKRRIVTKPGATAMAEQTGAPASQLEADRAQLEADRAAFEASKGQVLHDLSAFRSRVKLNVGGVRYETTAATLTRHGGSYFGALLSGRFAVPTDEDGSIFLDRSGERFGLVLDFLRTGAARMPDTAVEVAALLTELRYYMLDQPFVTACKDAAGAGSSGGDGGDAVGGAGCAGGVGAADYTRREMQGVIGQWPMARVRV